MDGGVRPIVADLSDPLLSPRRRRRILFLVLWAAVVVALIPFLMTQTGWDPGDYT